MLSEPFYKRAFQQVFQLFSANMVKAGFGFIGSIFVLRGWSSSDIGDIYTLVGVLLLFNQIGDLGTGSAFIQLMSRSKSEDERLIDTFLGFKLIVGLFLILGFVFFSALYLFYNPIREYYGLAAVSLTAIFGVYGGFFSVLINSRQQFYSLSLLKVVPPLVKTLLIILLYFLNEKSFFWLLLAFMVPSLTACLLGYMITGYSLLRSRVTEIFTQQGKRLYHMSKWIFLIGFCQVWFSQIDIFMLKVMSSDHQIAQFVSAQKLSTVVLLLSQAVFTVMLPKMRSFKTDAQLYRLNQKIFFSSIGLTLLMIPITYLAPWVVPVVVGAKYVEAIPILKIFLFQTLGHMFISSQSLIFYRKSKLPLLVAFSMTQLSLNVLGNYFVIYEYKALGAVWVSTLLNNLFYLLMAGYCYWLLKEKTKLTSH